MEAGDRLPFKQQDVRYASPREVIGSGGAREPRADNDAFVKIHNLTTAILCLLIAHSSAFSQPDHLSYSDNRTSKEFGSPGAAKASLFGVLIAH
jgi:hypothetical protein